MLITRMKSRVKAQEKTKEPIKSPTRLASHSPLWCEQLAAHCVTTMTAAAAQSRLGKQAPQAYERQHVEGLDDRECGRVGHEP